MIARLVALALVFALAACPEGRSRVDLTIFAAPQSGVSRLNIVVADAQGRMSTPLTVAVPTGSLPAQQTIELGFDRGVSGRVQITVSAIATNETTIFSGTTQVEVRPGKIVAASLSLGSGVGTDMSGTPPDLASVDLSGPRGNGQACGPSDTCLSGFCVDGVCCDRACDGQCEACDLSSSLGVCAPVTGAPRGGRTACTSDGPTCGGTCNGVDNLACTYPTVACRAASCTAGLRTEPASCTAGVCPMAQTACAQKSCDGDACMTVTQVDCGGDYTCALMSDKTVRCWGVNDFGQLGIGESDTTETRHPVPVTGLLNVKRIAASAQAFVCAILADNTVQCWGQNHRGQLGTGEDPATVLKHGAPHAVNGLGGAVDSISLGYAHACAIVGGGGNVQCWGRNIDGQIGNSTFSTTVPVLVPSYVCAPGSTGTSCTKMTQAAEVAAGAIHSCARLISGKTYCWGTNQSGQLTAGLPVETGTPHPDPVQFGNIDYQHRFYGGISENVSCVVVSGSGSMACAGDNQFNQLGMGTASGAVSTLYSATAVSGLTDLATGAGFSCGIFGSRVSCWGDNYDGVYGNGTTEHVTPLMPGDLTAIASGAVQVSAGSGHACAILNDGSLRCWGRNNHGQLGNDDTASSSVPISPNW